ncbi:MAG: transposase, partial [Microcystis sp. M110S1]
FGQAKRRFSLNRVMAKLPSTSETAIAITFLVINLSTLLRRVFWAFLCLKWKNRTFSGSMITISYNLEINQQLKLMLVAK